MSQTKTATALLVVALQDLYDGAQAWTERFQELRGATQDRALSVFVTALGRDAKRAARRLELLAAALDAAPEGSSNLWLRAELDDAQRDADTIVRGPLRDIAMIGAFRKAKQSERVSYETALLLARRLRMKEAANELRALRDEAGEADAELARQLRALVSTLGA